MSGEKSYGVKLVRGPVVELMPHPDTCETAEELITLAGRYTERGVPLAADLFCGAGGLGLGLRDAGFEVVVGVDNDPDALATHAAHFPGLHLPWDLAEEDHVEELSQLLLDAGVTLVAGGPPCQPFSKAGRNMIRDLVRKGRRPPKDQRRDLWQSFLAVVERVQPDAVLMENVPDMALERDMLLFRTMVDELERLGYGVDARLIETSRYGVPQHRQRLILVALKEGRRFDWPHESWGDAAPRETRLWDAIGDLPDVEPGWRPDDASGGGAPYAGPTTPFQERARERVPDGHRNEILDHITRPVRQDDLEAFRLMTADTKYSELPDHLKRYRDDIFDDKYKRLEKFALSRTITAHIAKDGYWYIHPEHHRTITVREAARIQTFRDDVRFSGPPTAAFRQIGNAVPPLLAEHLGAAIRQALNEPRSVAWSTREVSGRLADWFLRRRTTTVPWLLSTSRWCIVQAEMILFRARGDDVRHMWPVLEVLREPAATLAAAASLRRLGKRLDRSERIDQVLDVAAKIENQPDLLLSHSGLRSAGVPTAAADMACRIRPTSEADPVVSTNPVLRVAARVHGSTVDVRNKRSDGRMAVARLVGVDEPDDGRETAHLAHLALFEIAAAICFPLEPNCGPCPLRTDCVTGQHRLGVVPPLFLDENGSIHA
jgi:DNA (cytosine-5)-methyltransferase 1